MRENVNPTADSISTHLKTNHVQEPLSCSSDRRPSCWPFSDFHFIFLMFSACILLLWIFFAALFHPQPFCFSSLSFRNCSTFEDSASRRLAFQAWARACCSD